MADPIGLSDLKYKSSSIVERRHRILHTVRILLAESGYDGFNIRELCARAGIATKTLYNAFGNKDNVIAAAIEEHVASMDRRERFHYAAHTLEGRLERLLCIQRENMVAPGYTQAIVKIYYTGSQFVRDRIRAMRHNWNESFTTAIMQADAFQPGVTAEWFEHLIGSTIFSVTNDWCHGEITDDALLGRTAEMLLLIVLGTTRGTFSSGARRWLTHVRGNQPQWQALLSLTEPLSDEQSAADGLPERNLP